MNYRRATLSDFENLHAVRMAVKENVLENTHLVTYDIYKEMLEQHGCGWLGEDATGRVAGFSIVDLSRRNVWALFVHPDFEGKGIGSKLHQLMLDWSFTQRIDRLWLTTEPGTRAEKFYLKAGWQVKELQPDGELRLEITAEEWLRSKAATGSSGN